MAVCNCTTCVEYREWLRGWSSREAKRQEPQETISASWAKTTFTRADSDNRGSDTNTGNATGLPDANGGVPRMSSLDCGMCQNPECVACFPPKKPRTKYVLRLTAEQQQRAAEIIKKKIENPLMKCWISSESFWKDMAELKALLGIVEE